VTERTKLAQEAAALPNDERRRILMEIPEVELHDYLADLFQAMDPNYCVEVTHGPNELGKDLVIVRADPLSTDVMGVIVKRGNIRAKTAGDVDKLQRAVTNLISTKPDRVTDELLSQIGQAKKHPAELRSFFATLPTNKIIVVLVGDLSKNARKRLEAELGAGSSILDIAWLVDKFTEFYPQVFFDGRAVDFLDGLIQTLEQDAFYSKTGKNLSECFVDPVVAQLSGNVSLDDANLALHVRNRRIAFGHLTAMLPQTKRVLLVGDPGSGKSKAVAKVCIDTYRKIIGDLTRNATQTQSRGIPLIVPARRLQNVTSADVLLDTILPLTVRERFSLQTLIVDGLDEVPAQQRKDLLDKAKQFATHFDACLLITSRKIAMLNAPPPGFERYELLPFAFSQAMKLMQKLLTNADDLPAIHDGLQRIQSQIPMSPLSLLLLVELVAERKEIPSSITELYDRFLDLVFGRWDHEKGVEVLFEYIVKKRFLAALAFKEFHEKNRLEIPQSGFEAFIHDYATAFGWDGEKLREFVKEVERAGIVQIHDEVFFRHRSFLDYFSALYLHEQRTSFPDLHGKVTDLYFDSIWGEVAFFYAGLGREVAPELLDRILSFDRPGLDLSVDKLLVGRLLQAGWHSPTALKAEGIRRALEHVPGAIATLESLVNAANLPSGLLYSGLFTMLLAELSLGSTFLSHEVIDAIAELRDRDDKTFDHLLRRTALLWGARHIEEPQVLDKEINALVLDIEAAGLQPVREAQLLLLGGLANPSNAETLKAVKRRLKRLARQAPGAFRGLAAPKKKGFRDKK
jgi:hypothetical protein